MSFVSSDLRERHAYVDRTLESTLAALSIPEVAQVLGHYAAAFAEVISSAVVVNVVHGEASMPNTHRNDTDSLPIVAIRPDDRVVVSKAFDGQTTTQRKNTLRQFRAWGADNDTAQEIYDAITVMVQRDPMSINYLEESGAQVSSRLSMLPAEILKTYFPKGPEKGLALVDMRPVLALNILPGHEHVEAEYVVHELVHVQKKEEEPVMVTDSQHCIDMAHLREELEAYHIGSMVMVGRLQRIGYRLSETDNISQIEVDAIRHKHGIDTLDPYRPSPTLLEKLKVAGFGAIIDGRQDYEQLRAVWRLAAQTD